MVHPLALLPVSEHSSVSEHFSQNILNGYKQDLIDKITILELRGLEDKTYKNKKLLEETRLLACLIARNIQDYEDKVYRANHIPAHVKNQYNRFFTATECSSTLEDNLTAMIRITSWQNLDNPTVISWIKMLVDSIALSLIEAETTLAVNLLFDSTLCPGDANNQ